MPLKTLNQKINPNFQGLSEDEYKFLKRLSTPSKIQDFLDTLPMNFSDTDPCFSVRDVLRERRAHCFEGALLAAAALMINGAPPLLLDLTTNNNDEDHVVAVYKAGKFYGAISKTNHAVLRFRDPIYKTVRELVMSYFHEYFLNNGQKTLRTFSKQPFDLSKYNKLNWLTSRDGILDIIDELAQAPHEQILSPQQIKQLRKASSLEIQVGKFVEWKR